MRGLFLSGPLENIENPSEEYLRHLVFDSDETYWNAGCGDAGLNVQRPESSDYVYNTGEPALIFFFEQDTGFFFRLQRVDGIVFVPYNGMACDDLVSHYVGGEPFWVPRACYVSRETAWNIVKDYIDRRERSSSVQWVPFEELKYKVPGFDD
jgi:hypothetical protein